MVATTALSHSERERTSPPGDPPNRLEVRILRLWANEGSKNIHCQFLHGVIHDRSLRTVTVQKVGKYHHGGGQTLPCLSQTQSSRTRARTSCQGRDQRQENQPINLTVLFPEGDFIIDFEIRKVTQPIILSTSHRTFSSSLWTNEN